MRLTFFTRRSEDEEQIEQIQSRREAFFCVLIPLGLFIAFFWRAFDPDVSFSYRDAAYYYYPLFQQVQAEWERGALPLWDPFSNLGQPLLADPTASVFYPIKALFFLSSFGLLSYATCFKLYVWLHVWLAFAASFILARRIHVSRAGALLSGVAYAFSGQVLFQYSNVIYLVGSAWAPTFFIFLVDYLRATNFRSKLRAIFKASVAFALCVLGGEPQIVYLGLFLSAFILLLAPKREQNEASQELAPNEKKRSRVPGAAFYCASTALLTFLLAAVQILPAAEFIARSERSRDPLIRSVWDVPKAAFRARENADARETSVKEAFRQGTLCLDFPEGRGRMIYKFSVGAWRWSEFFFPNVGGRTFPKTACWFEILPAYADWTPTLYCGVLPLLLALAAARDWFSRRKNARENEQYYARVVAVWCAIFGALAALGGFGLVWHIATIQSVFNGTGLYASFCDGDPVGGLYWLLNLLAPMFSGFRYPAKMLTITLLGVAVLAGIGWDRERNSPRFGALALTLFLCALGFYALTTLYGASFFGAISFNDDMYGPFLPRLTQKIVSRSFIQTSIVVALSLGLLYCARRVRNPRVKNALLYATLATTALDLYVANGWIVDVVPTNLFERPSELARQIEDERAEITSDCAPPTRIYRYPVWFPALFKEENSSQRTTERVVWDAMTLFPKYPASRGIALIDARGAAMDGAYWNYVDKLIKRSNVDDELAFLGVEGALGPRAWVERLLEREETDATKSGAQNVVFQRVHARTTRAALFRKDERVPESSLDCVETLEYVPNKIVYFIRASELSEAVFAEQYWPDWRAKTYALTREEADELRASCGKKREIDALVARRAEDATRPPNVASVEKVFEFMRKIDVPQGDVCVVVEYRPRAVLRGVLLSTLAWCAFGLGGFYLFRKGSPENPTVKRSVR